MTALERIKANRLKKEVEEVSPPTKRQPEKKSTSKKVSTTKEEN